MLRISMPRPESWPEPPVLRMHKTRTGLRLLAAILTVLVATPLQAGPLEDARQAYTQGDYPAALKLLEPLSKEGNGEALALLSVFYKNGLGVTRDPDRAIDLLTRAAESGLAFAQHDLGLRYYQGEDVAQNYRAAIKWWGQAASAGLPDSQFNLGLIYFRGLETDPDLERAKTLFEQASKQGHDHALYSLGVIYAFGQGVEVDYLQARLLFQRAANLGVAHAQYNLGVLYENGFGTRKDLSEARRWYRLAAAQTLPEAQTRLAQLEGEDPTTRGFTLPAPIPAVPAVAAQEPVSKPPPPPPVARPPARPKAPPTASAPGDVVHRADWIRQQPTASYTLQLVSVNSKADVLEFVGKHVWTDEISYATVRDKNGRNSYKAFYGSYVNSTAARSAIQALPTAVRKNKPWPRRFGDVQAALAE